MVVGVLTGIFSPARGLDEMVRCLAGIEASAATRLTGPISWIRLVT